MQQPTRSSLLLLALAGFSSSLLFVNSKYIADFSMLTVGLFFGIALALYFVYFEGYRTYGTVVAFICACTAAYPAAFLAALWSMHSFRIDNSTANFPLPPFFAAGFVGATTVIAAGLFALGPGNITPKSLGRILLWSLGGGLLGVIGAAADRLLFLIWQPGAAVLLGLFLKQERAASRALAVSHAPSSGPRHINTKRESQIVAAVFFACVIGFLSFVSYQTFLGAKLQAGMNAARERYLAGAPPMAHLRAERIPIEQALILREIGGLYPLSPTVNSFGVSSRTAPPTTVYRVDYGTAKNPGELSSHVRVVVTLTELPNAEWAQFWVRYSRNDPSSSTHLPQVVKFGQTFFRDTYGLAQPCLLWPSGDFVVSVCSYGSEVDEEFLQQYLEKYPSSLQLKQNDTATP